MPGSPDTLVGRLEQPRLGSKAQRYRRRLLAASVALFGLTAYSQVPSLPGWETANAASVLIAVTYGIINAPKLRINRLGSFYIAIILFSALFLVGASDRETAIPLHLSYSAIIVWGCVSSRRLGVELAVRTASNVAVTFSTVACLWTLLLAFQDNAIFADSRFAGAGNANQIAMVSVAALAALPLSDYWNKHLARWSIVILTLFPVVLTQSRGAMLLCILALWPAFPKSTGKRILVLVVVTIIAFSPILGMLADFGIGQRLQTRGLGSDGRSQIILALISAANVRPISGLWGVWGLDANHIYVPSLGKRMGSHNRFADEIYQFGYPLAFVLSACRIAIVAESLKLRKAGLTLPLLVCFLSGAFGPYSWNTTYVVGAFGAFLTGAVLARDDRRKRATAS